MKLEGEPIFVQSTLFQGPDLENFEHNENTPDNGRMKVNMGEEKKGINSDKKIKRCDMDTNSFKSEGNFVVGIKNESRFDEVEDMEALTNEEDKQTADSVNPFTIPSSGSKFYEKERDFYTDKSVTDCELPVLMVFKEGAYHFVKDICVDDGLPSLDKVLIENSKVHNNGDSKFQHSDMDVNTDLTKEKVDGAASISTWRNPFVEYDCETDVAEEFGCPRSIQYGEGDSNEGVNDVSGEKAFPEISGWTQELDIANYLDDVSIEKVMPKTLNLPEKLDGDNSLDEISNEKVMAKSSNFAEELEAGNSLDEVSDEKAMPKILHLAQELDADNSSNEIPEKAITETLHLAQELDFANSQDDVLDERVMPQTLHVTRELDLDNSPDSSNLNRDEDQQRSDQGTSSTSSGIPSAAEESNNCNHANEALLSNSKAKSGSINLDFDSLPPTTSGREEDSKDKDSQPPVQTLNMPIIEEGMVDGRTASSRSFFIQHGLGETSFSAAGPLSGPISYSGSVPYSGSISHRSDSSTTSTRSFAFPILNTEWNTSPVKMAKADRRHFRKHQGWRMSLLCCRF